MTHSPEPWRYADGEVAFTYGPQIIDKSDVAWTGCDDNCERVSKDNAERIVACVNACAGIPADKLWTIREALIFCHAYSRFLQGSDNAICGMSKIAHLVTQNTTDPLGK